MEKETRKQVAPPEPKPVLGDVNDYLDFLDEEIFKADNYGRDCQHKDNDLLRAGTWYSIAEALRFAKQKAIEILNSEHSPKKRFRNKISGVEGVLVRRVSKVFKGDTFVLKTDDGREYFGPAREFVPV